MSSPHRIASLSLDLDNRWSYLKVHGDPGWEEFPSYLDLLVPRVLQFLSARNLRITFFVVGQDAALEKNHSSLRMIAAAGHEIGNHSFSHEPWFHLYERKRVESEICLAEEDIYKVTGYRPIGYRGPGFSLSESALWVLKSRGYLYDASTFPTFVGPLARLYYMSHSRLSGRALDERNRLFGSLSDGTRPLRLYQWCDHDGLVEIPVTTMPFLRTPIHLSYLLYLSRISRRLALTYFQTALQLCHTCSVSPSLLLHPLDFLGADDRIGLEFFPGMQLARRQKLEFVSEAIRIYCDQFQVMPVRNQVQKVLGNMGERERKPTAALYFTNR